MLSARFAETISSAGAREVNARSKDAFFPPLAHRVHRRRLRARLYEASAHL